MDRIADLFSLLDSMRPRFYATRNVMRIFILFFLTIALAFGQYKTLDSALLNGTKQVDIVLYGNFMSSGGGGYYTNNLYGSSRFLGNAGLLNASVGLGYTTGFYYNLRAAISFRAAQGLLNYNDGVKKYFYNNTGNEVLGGSSVALGESFIEYFDGDTAIKAGRFQPISPWINHLIDGIWVRNGSVRNLVIEAIWAYNFGRVSYYEMTRFMPLDKTGWFNVGVKYYFNGDQKDIKNSAYMSGFTTFIPSVFATAGIRGHFATRFNGGNVWWFGADLGFAGSFEDHKSLKSFHNNTFLFDSKVTIGYKNIDAMIGYVASGNAGMGSLGILGVGNGTQADMSNTFYTNIQPFFVWGGRAIKMGNNAHLIYAATRLGLLDNKLNMYFAYGATFFNGSNYYGGNRKNLTQSEFNAMLEFGITQTLSAITHISSTHFSRGVPSTFEINGGLRFMF